MVSVAGSVVDLRDLARVLDDARVVLLGDEASHAGRLGAHKLGRGVEVLGAQVGEVQIVLLLLLGNLLCLLDKVCLGRLLGVGQRRLLVAKRRGRLLVVVGRGHVHLLLLVGLLLLVESGTQSLHKEIGWRRLRGLEKGLAVLLVGRVFLDVVVLSLPTPGYGGPTGRGCVAGHSDDAVVVLW
jgi:hypothetical protein